jgi:hypothetical protein
MSGQQPNKYWAVLVGIDYYASYRNLRGCVQDVNDVEELLRSRIHAAALEITKLTSSAPDEPQPPTYGNVMGAFEKVRAEAKPGDFIYVHFSGHGSRTQLRQDDEQPTQPPTANLSYEVLVLEGGQHLKDFEFGQVLDGLASKGLLVFFVLDCCHSGGADRLAEDTVRGIDAVFDERTSRGSQRQSADDSFEEKINLTRDGSAKKSYWQRARNYTILAACQPHEKAQEFRHHGKTNGALTYWMLQSLSQLSSPRVVPTYEMLHRDIYSSMFAEFPSQHSMPLGERERILFGSVNFRGV